MNESQIFANALKIASSAERAAYLDAACAGDRRLRADVEALLRAHANNPDFLEQPVAPLGGTVAEVPADGSPSSSEQPGVVLAGRYKLLEAIGEGGMGSVWMAQQTEPVRRLVAVKLIKAGMDSKQVLARFAAERQALALMDHPNIARVLDAGATPDGRPFFVMELVKGVPITKYCDEHRLSPRQRLELFVPVCQAIQHAHQKGVIHRDVKPSNVLVALYDDKPVVKVIDFGVAKATGQQLTEQTLHTGFGAVVGTLEYMSPEQASFNQLDIDTRSDIYSLGVLLYELLTGGPPFRRKDLEQAGMLEMLRVIREQEPSRPSKKLSTAEGLPHLAANRGTEPRRLAALLRGELDWVVMKALEKDRTRRYETANGFAMDVQRYLADEPVIACPPSAGYRLRKFVWRQKGPLAVAALALSFLVILAVGSLLAAAHSREQEQQQRALAEHNQRLAEHNERLAGEKEAERLKAVQAQGEAEAAQKLEAGLRHQAQVAEQAAVQARRLAEERAEELRRTLYVTELNIAAQAAEGQGGIARLDQLLANWREGKPDLRGWEWFYLRGLYHRDLLTISDFGRQVWAVAWSPDGTRLAAGDQNGFLWTLDAATGKKLLTFQGATTPIGWVSWSPDGKRLASSAGYQTKVWDLATRKDLLTLKGHFPVWSPEGTRLATSGDDGEGVRVWDAGTGKIALGWTGTSVCWGPEGRLAFFKGPALMGMDLTTGKERQVAIVPSGGSPQTLSWSPDGAYLSWGTRDGTIFCHDLAQGEKAPFNLRGHTGAVERLSWSPDGKYLASSGSDQTVRVWDPARKQEALVIRGHDSPATSLSWSPDGTRLASAGGADGTVKIWAVKNEPYPSGKGSEQTTCVCWSADGKQLAWGNTQGTITIWDAVRGEVRRTVKGHPGQVISVTWSPDGKHLASAGTDRTVRVWDPAGGTEVLNVEGAEARVVSWSPDGQRLAFDGTGTVQVWDLPSKGEAFTLAGWGPVSWSPDGTRLLMCVDPGRKIIQVWDLPSGKGGHTLKGHNGGVISFSWSPDGTRLASASNDRTVKVWDPAAGKEVVSLAGHSQGVVSVSWSPDGTRLASGSVQVVKIWDLATTQEVLTLKTHFGTAMWVSWSPDGTRLAVAGNPPNPQPVSVLVFDATRGYQLEGLPGPRPLRPGKAAD